MLREGFEDMVDQGLAYNQSSVNLGTSPVGMCVQSDMKLTADDISTEESLRDTLLNDCETIAVSDSASGRYMISDVYPALGIESEMNNRTNVISSDETGRVGTLVVEGDERARCAFQQVPELLETECEYVGNIPSSLQKYSDFVGGIAKSIDPGHFDAANLMLYFLSSPADAPVIEHSGMVPGTPAVPGGWTRVSYSYVLGEGMHQE